MLLVLLSSGTLSIRFETFKRYFKYGLTVTSISKYPCGFVFKMCHGVLPVEGKGPPSKV